MRSRFKAIAVVNNQEKLNMARLISPFNGKPVLITESGSLERGTRKPSAAAEAAESAAAGEGEGGPADDTPVVESGAGGNGGVMW